MLSQQFNQLIQDYRAFLFLVVCLAAQFLAWRLWMRLAGSRRVFRRLIQAAFVIFNLGWFFTVALIYYDQALSDVFWTWVGRPSVSWQVVYLLGLIPGAAAAALIVKLIDRRSARRKAPEDQAAAPGRREFLRTAGAAGCLAVLGLCGYGVFRQGRPPMVERLTVAIKGLPRALHGLVIAQVSDIHLGLWSSQKELDQALALVAAEKPDLVALTGDLVDRDPHFAKLYHEPLKRLAGTPLGVWGVLGNHDHYTGPLEITRLLDGQGLTMLVDRQVRLAGLPLTLIGLDDQGLHHSWMGSANRAASEDQDDPDVLKFHQVAGPPPRPDDFVILLNHRPEGVSQAVRHGCRLYLAGHTHGGQYQVPGHDQLNLAASFYKYSSGLYQVGQGYIYVSRGLAAVGVPFRLWAWPEVSLLTLEAV